MTASTTLPHGRSADPVTRALDRVLLVFLFGAGFSIAVEQSTAILAGLIWIVALVRRRRRPRLPLLWPSVAFLTAAFVACVTALDPWRAFWQLKSEWVPFVLYLVVANLPTDERSASRRVHAMTVVAALMVMSGLVQTFQHGVSFRITGTLGHYMTYSGVLVLLGLPMLASLLFAAEPGGGGRRRFSPAEIARILVLIAMGGALVLTQTRGAWIGAFAGLTVLVSLWRARWLAALPVLAVVAFLLAPPATRARIVALADLRDVTAIERVYMWRAAADMVRDRPVTGVGVDNFRLAIDDYRLPDDPWLPDRKLNHAHSNPFMLAAERGLLGLGAWLVLWLVWAVVMARAWRGFGADERLARGVVAGSIAAVIAFHLSGLTEYNWGDTEVVYLAAFVMGTGLAHVRDARLDPGTKP